MKWTYIIQQKTKVALLLTCIMLLVIVSNLLGRKNIVDINTSFTSIYNDRLIPATDIFYLTQNLYSKKLLMEQFLFSDKENNIAKLQSHLNKHNNSIDSLIQKFEKTYLVDQESRSLAEFKKSVVGYGTIEKSILGLYLNQLKEDAQNLYTNQGKPTLQNAINHLYDLIEIQSSVGKELINDSEDIMYNTNLLSMLQITLAILIGGIIHALVLSSKVVNHRDQFYDLN